MSTLNEQAGWAEANRRALRMGALEGLLDAIFASDERGRLDVFKREFEYKMREWQDADTARHAATLAAMRKGIDEQGRPGAASP